jgi:hypothetical protein
MPWDSKFSNFIIVKIEGKNVKVYSAHNSYVTIYVGQEVSNAIWDGSGLNVTLKNGKVRRYRDRVGYLTI